MPLLEFKSIGKQEHLTFESIRRSAFGQLPKPTEYKARWHMEDCNRCQSIHDSFTKPAQVRRQISKSSVGLKLFAGLLLVMALIGSASSFLYFGDAINPHIKDLADLWELYFNRLHDNGGEKIAKLTPNPPATGMSPDFKNSATPTLKIIDPLGRISNKPEAGITVAATEQFDSFQKKEVENDRIRLRGVYGKITANGDPLQGVTVMVPGGKTARVTDANGKYYIQVPNSTNSLLFIYQGKQLVKDLDPESRQQDIHLKMENMLYPEIDASASLTENM